jgi:pimeloyl-ACP methyl ester carboxylesterase
MFGKLIGQLAVPFLLASTLQTSPPAQQQAVLTSLKEIRSGMDQMYQDLVDCPGNVTKRISPTLQFSYVSPPVDGISTWRSSSSSSSSVAAESLPSSSNKPLAIYLPGLDGTGISAFTHQFDDLANTFELWRFIIDTADRSDFSRVLRSVADFIVDHHSHREIVLIGESFGGVLASAVALKLQNSKTTRNPLKGLVLVNPATAFHDTNWDIIVPLLASLQYLGNSTNTNVPTPYSLAGGLALSVLIPDNNQLGRIGTLVLNAVGIPPPADTVQDVAALLAILEERLPAETLLHRVSQWLGVGTSLVNGRLASLQTPTLVVAGDQDRIMPSDKEVVRLAKLIPSCETLLVRGRGHFVLDENVNLTEAILYSNIDPWNQSSSKNSRYDPIVDWTLPSQDIVKEIIERQVNPLRRIHSPVFFSTDANGKRWRGLAKIPPAAGPILFVANHQFCKCCRCNAFCCRVLLQKVTLLVRFLLAYLNTTVLVSFLSWTGSQSDHCRTIGKTRPRLPWVGSSYCLQSDQAP